MDKEHREKEIGRLKAAIRRLPLSIAAQALIDALPGFALNVLIKAFNKAGYYG